MIRMTVFVRRREGMTHDEFLEHWRTRHGPLIAGEPTLARHLVRYEQHARADVPDWAGTVGYDGVAVQVFASFDAFLAFLNEPAYAELVAPDEGRFLDRASVLWQFRDDPVVVIDGPSDVAGAAAGDDPDREGTP